jgi:DNA-binding NarL/FixJ family response regulator
MNQAIRVLIVESEPLFRRGLAGCVRASEAFHLVAEACRIDEAFRMLDEHAPDVVLVGTISPDAHSVQVAGELRQHYSATATVVISASESDDELFAAIRAGASAYCGRDVDESVLYDLIRRSAAGEYVINEQLLSKPYVAARVLDQFRNTSQQEQRLAGTFMPLTDRELEILKKVSTGLTNAEIGYSLGISAQTVKNHVTSILRKLAVNDRTQAVVTALRHGWLSIDDEELNGSVKRVAHDGHREPSATPASQRREH